MSLDRATALLAALVLVGATGCAGPPGDLLLSLPDRPDLDQKKLLTATLERVAALLDRLPVDAERKRPLASLKPGRIIQSAAPIELGLTSDTVVLTNGDADVGVASDSVIIAAGAVRISHSENSVVVSGRDIAISHDGTRGGGSLVVSKGATRISHARNTLVYAPAGLEVSFATNVRAFNTSSLEAAWGHIGNTVIRPLFEK